MGRFQCSNSQSFRSDATVCMNTGSSEVVFCEVVCVLVSYLNKIFSLWLAFLYCAHESFPTLREVCVCVCVSLTWMGDLFYGKQQLTLAFQGLSIHFQFVVIVSHPTGM